MFELEEFDSLPPIIVFRYSVTFTYFYGLSLRDELWPNTVLALPLPVLGFPESGEFLARYWDNCWI